MGGLQGGVRVGPRGYGSPMMGMGIGMGIGGRLGVRGPPPIIGYGLVPIPQGRRYKGSGRRGGVGAGRPVRPWGTVGLVRRGPYLLLLPLLGPRVAILVGYLFCAHGVPYLFTEMGDPRN